MLLADQKVTKGLWKDCLSCMGSLSRGGAFPGKGGESGLRPNKAMAKPPFSFTFLLFSFCPSPLRPFSSPTLLFFFFYFWIDSKVAKGRERAEPLNRLRPLRANHLPEGSEFAATEARKTSSRADRIHLTSDIQPMMLSY